MSILQKISYTFLGMFFSLSAFASGDPFGTGRENLNVEEKPLEEAVQDYVNTAMTFLALLAIMYALYGGFLILTAGGDDDKVSTGKKILINGGIGLVVIFLAGAIVKWVIGIIV